MGWIFILLILLALFFFVKLTNVGQNVWSYFIVIGAVFLIISLIYVGAFTGIDFTSFEGILAFGKVYALWLGSFFRNVGNITGNVINLDWSLNATA